jgi:hypothetical protein
MATLSLTIPDDQIPRVLAAFGTRLINGDTTPATVAEVRASLIQFVKDRVRAHEYELARVAAATGIVDVEAT